MVIVSVVKLSRTFVLRVFILNFVLKGSLIIMYFALKNDCFLFNNYMYIVYKNINKLRFYTWYSPISRAEKA